MPLTACPAAVVAAPVEFVWANLVQWERYADWADVHVLESDPEGPAVAGQRITLGPKVVGRVLNFQFAVEAIDPDRHHVQGLVSFPFGLRERAHISCTPIDATSCRVQYG